MEPLKRVTRKKKDVYSRLCVSLDFDAVGPVLRHDLTETRECISIAEREGHAAAARTLRSKRTFPCTLFSLCSCCSER